MKRCLLALAATLAMLAIAATTPVAAMEGPYEDIQGLLASARASSSSLAGLDLPGPPRVIEVHHDHHHVVPHDMPAHVAEHLAVVNTPPPPPVRVVEVPNRAQAARHAAEDAQYERDLHAPSVTTVDVKHTVSISAPAPAPAPSSFTVKGQRGDSKDEKAWQVKGTGFQFPLVDRGLQRPRYSVIADTDGSDKASTVKPHTAADLQAEALKLLRRAKKLKAKAADKKQAETLGVFDSKDEGFEDELTRLKRVSARMNRLLEQIETPRPDDSFEGHIARQKYYLKIYGQLKKQATEIIESYALRTGNSIFAAFGDGKIDPNIAAFLPPNSVAAILAQYSNPNRGRTDETPRDVISGRDAKRIRYAIDYYHAKKKGSRMPLPPVFAPSAEDEAAKARDSNPLLNKVIATQEGAFGQGRPAVTSGTQGIGRSSVHISVVNPTETQHLRGLPYQVNLQVKDPNLA